MELGSGTEETGEGCPSAQTCTAHAGRLATSCHLRSRVSYLSGGPPQLPTALPGDCHPTEPFSLALGSGCPVYPSCSSAWIHLCLYPEHKLILSLLMAEWC